MTELRPREDAAVKAHERDPFRVLAGPAERFQFAISSPQGTPTRSRMCDTVTFPAFTEKMICFVFPPRPSSWK